MAAKDVTSDLDWKDNDNGMVGDGNKLPIEPDPNDKGSGYFIPAGEDADNATKLGDGKPEPGDWTTPADPATDPADPAPPPATSTGGSSSTGIKSVSAPSTPQADPAPTAPDAPGGPGIPDSGTGMEAEMTPWDVTEEQTVMGQMEKNYDQNSPFFELAAERAKRAHLSSGGQNSLMAEQAGVIAAMDKAFEVSKLDAATYARSAEFNAAMKNQFGLAEQRFIHNATLSDQNFEQSKVLMKQQIQGQMDLAAYNLQGQFDLAAFNHANTIDQLWESAAIHENAEQQGFSRTMALNAATSLNSFMTTGFAAVMESSNNPNFTPEQSTAAFNSGMSALVEQFNVQRAFWLNQTSGASSGNSEASFPYSDVTTQNYGSYTSGGYITSPEYQQWYQEQYGTGG